MVSPLLRGYQKAQNYAEISDHICRSASLGELFRSVDSRKLSIRDDETGRHIFHTIAENPQVNKQIVNHLFREQFRLINQPDNKGISPLKTLLDRNATPAEILSFIQAGANPEEFLRPELKETTEFQLVAAALSLDLTDINALITSEVEADFEIFSIEETQLHRAGRWQNQGLFRALKALGANPLILDSRERLVYECFLSDPALVLDNPAIGDEVFRSIALKADIYREAALWLDQNPGLNTLIQRTKFFRHLYQLKVQSQHFKENYQRQFSEESFFHTSQDPHNYAALSFADALDLILRNTDWELFVQKETRGDLFKQGSYQQVRFFFDYVRNGVNQMISAATSS